jgi:HPt (histidine-containing phosphotransfer) domain-containing protein
MSENKPYDLAFLNKISGGDESFIREMITTFKEVAPEYMMKATHYLGNNSIDSLSKETHRFIPGVSFLGAKLLEEDLLKIEDFTKKHEHLELLPSLLSSVKEKINDLIESFDRDFNQ